MLRTRNVSRVGVLEFQEVKDLILSIVHCTLIYLIYSSKMSEEISVSSTDLYLHTNNKIG